MKGKFIVIEGTDCSGKETQNKLIEKRLKKEGINFIRFSFPMYDTPTGKIIGDYYLGKKGKSIFKEGAVAVDPHIAVLYYAADRKYNITKALEYYNKGYYIILDRYTSSNQAHQGSKIDNQDERFNMYQWIDKLEYWLLGLPKPDKTIFLHVPSIYVKNLLNSRKELDDHEKDFEYLEKSEKAYIELSELYGWNKIECVKDQNLKTIEEINNEILDIIKK